jgi:hypothetical protein
VLKSKAGTMANGLEAQAFVTELGASLLLKGLGCTSEGGVCASKGSLVAKVRRDVGTLEGSKEGLGGAEAVAAGGTALAQDGNLDAAEGSENDTTRSAVSVEERVVAGGAGVDVCLSGKGSLLESVAHGLASSVEDEGLDGFNGGGCGHLDGQGYCEAHEKSSW